MLKSTFCTVPLRSLFRHPKSGVMMKIDPRHGMTESGQRIAVKDAELVTKVK